jgi:TDG/mug DNA glycosylase family protein
LRDVPPPPDGILFVGINPGLRSAALGHHFAGHSNRFWRLLYDAHLVPEPITWRDDRRMAEWGFGITNLVARATAGSSDLSLSELRAGRRALARKVRGWRPKIVALVGVTVYRSLIATADPVALGRSEHTFAGARLFVLPNPSGRNAHFTYAEMRRAYRALRTA